MRLLMVNSLYPPHRVGGAEQSVALLAQALARDGVDVHVATLWRGTGEASVVEDGVTVHRVPLDQPDWPWGHERRPPLSRAMWHVRDRANAEVATRLGRLIDRVRPDLVHGHVLTGFGGGLWGEVGARGLPLAQTLRDYALICSRSALFRKGRPCTKRCLDCRMLTAPTRAASRQVDAVAGNSDYTLHAHRAAGRFEGVEGRRLFNVVPVRGAGAGEVRRAAASGPLRFGFLGRVEVEKGIDLLLDALPLIGREGWRLRIGGVGRVETVARLRNAHRDARVDWLGQVEAGAFFESIDVMVVPSRWPEPLPRSLVEAAAHGCSIIAAEAGGIGEVAGVAGCSTMVAAGNAASLATAMRDAIDAPERWRSRLVSAAALAPFSEAAVVAAHHDFYEAARTRASRRKAGG
jgi:glycosyltransferase involved in cell wall biosynthesis